MKRALLLMIGLCIMAVRSVGQQDITKLPADSTLEKSKVHFRTNYKTEHSYHPGFLHAGIHKAPHVSGGGRQVLGLKSSLRNGYRPLFSEVFGTFSPAVKIDLCPCAKTGIRLYQCPPGKVNNKVLQPPAVPSKKIAELAGGDDGGLNIGLTEKTSLTLDLGYSKSSGNDLSNDLTTSMDSEGDDGLDISIGLQFGIR